MSRSFKNVKETPANLLKAVVTAVQESKKKSGSLCNTVIKIVCGSGYNKEEVVNAIKGMCKSGHAHLSKATISGKNQKFGSRRIVLIKNPCESESETDSDSDSSDDCN